MQSTTPIEYKSFLNRSISSVEETLTDNTLPCQSGTGSNGWEAVLHTL